MTQQINFETEEQSKWKHEKRQKSSTLSLQHTNHLLCGWSEIGLGFSLKKKLRRGTVASAKTFIRPMFFAGRQHHLKERFVSTSFGLLLPFPSSFLVCGWCRFLHVFRVEECCFLLSFFSGWCCLPLLLLWAGAAVSLWFSRSSWKPN